MKLKFAVLCALGFAAFNASACFTVYDRNARVIYQGIQTPVDMRLQFHETVGRTHPGSHLVFDDSSSNCAPVQLQTVSLLSTQITERREVRRGRGGKADRN
jgi:hypothetical protein